MTTRIFRISLIIALIGSGPLWIAGILSGIYWLLITLLFPIPLLVGAFFGWDAADALYQFPLSHFWHFITTWMDAHPIFWFFWSLWHVFIVPFALGMWGCHCKASEPQRIAFFDQMKQKRIVRRHKREVERIAWENQMKEDRAKALRELREAEKELERYLRDD